LNLLSLIKNPRFSVQRLDRTVDKIITFKERKIVIVSLSLSL
jgi:hypothetical protein